MFYPQVSDIFTYYWLDDEGQWHDSNEISSKGRSPEQSGWRCTSAKEAKRTAREQWQPAKGFLKKDYQYLAGSFEPEADND